MSLVKEPYMTESFCFAFKLSHLGVHINTNNSNLGLYAVSKTIHYSFNKFEFFYFRITVIQMGLSLLIILNILSHLYSTQ